jgi:plastocyanin
VSTAIEGFALQDLTVPLGATVTWTHKDTVAHTTTSGSMEHPTGIWDSGNLNQGQMFSHTFGQVGEFPYYCRRHPSTMRATVRVVPSLEDGATPQGAPGDTGRGSYTY